MNPNVRFFRHGGICRPMNDFFNHLGRSTAPRPGSTQAYSKDAPEVPRPTHRRDEYRPAIPQRVARQHCPPPLYRHAHPKTVPGSATMNFQRTVNSVLTVCLNPGDHPNRILLLPPSRRWSNRNFDSIVTGVDWPCLAGVLPNRASVCEFRVVARLRLENRKLPTARTGWGFKSVSPHHRFSL